MINIKLEKIINSYLNSNNFQDFSPNGLQVEGKKEVKKIVTGVTACQDLIDKAIFLDADAIIVHHGYFWKNESYLIKNIKRKRLKSLLSNNINLYSWHLPLDFHKTIGNNYLLAKILNIKIINNLHNQILIGKINKKITCLNLKKIITKKLNRKPFQHCSINANKYIHNIALCTGNGQNYIDLLYNLDVDAFITGEISEKTIHIIRESKIHFFAAGHHATEIFGIISLGKWLKKEYNFDVKFINIDSPI